jgi:hypothetical protein
MEAALNSRSLEATEVPPNFNTIKDTCYRSSDFEAEAGRAPGGSRPANGSYMKPCAGRTFRRFFIVSNQRKKANNFFGLGKKICAWLDFAQAFQRL